MLAIREIFHRYGGAPSSKSLVHEDPPSRKDPKRATRTGCRCSASQYSAESPEILESAKIARKRFEDEATMTQGSVHLLLDQILLHLDLTMVVMCERDL